MKKRLLDRSDVNHYFKKKLRTISDKNIVPTEVLSRVQETISSEYVGRRIETSLGVSSLTIFSEKKKNAALGLIKDSIEGIMLSHVDSGDMDLLFNIHKLDNRVIIETKRIIEQ
ncbi:hypothetical protein [Romboutsia ilealis]|uniref:hypothetical protein n=1 Tax=Romboutsia ilealis TaxID=1115758 RepID=UPI00272B7429|nr:hypothetical protein [Romboutsia ilealis]